MLRSLIKNFNSFNFIKAACIGSKRQIKGDTLQMNNAKDDLSVDFVEATTKDSGKVFRFLSEHFYTSEPIYTALKWCPASEDEAPFFNCLDEKLSFFAVEKNDPEKLLGLAINRKISRFDRTAVLENKTNLSESHKNKGALVDEFLSYSGKFMMDALEKNWIATQTDTAFYIFIIVVNKSVTQKNLGNIIIKKCIEIARENNFRWIAGECTSRYGAYLTEKNGFKLANEIKYADYKKNGEVVFKTEPPHTTCSLWIKDLNAP